MASGAATGSTEYAAGTAVAVLGGQIEATRNSPSGGFFKHSNSKMFFLGSAFTVAGQT